MTNAFVDEYLSENVQGLPCQVQPRFSTRIVLAKSGDETRNRNWQAPLRKFMLPEAICDQNDLEDALDFWLIVGGPAANWPFRDPTEFASCRLTGAGVVPAYAASDQVLGTGDGLTSTFQLVKVRQIGSATFSRTILLPVVSTIGIFFEGHTPAATPPALGGPYTITSVSRPGGKVSISPAPKLGVTMTWGGLFDTLVRFEADDTFDAVMHAFMTSGASPLNFVESRSC